MAPPAKTLGFLVQAIGVGIVWCTCLFGCVSDCLFDCFGGFGCLVVCLVVCLSDCLLGFLEPVCLFVLCLFVSFWFVCLFLFLFDCLIVRRDWVVRRHCPVAKQGSGWHLDCAQELLLCC